MGRIAEESIQRVIATVDIVDLVSSYFPLKRAGTAWKACCPFHTERTPSFTVSPSRNTFHCFGCGKGGNAIRFVMDYENLPFADAVRKLAGKYNIVLVEEASTPESQSAAAQRVRLLALHRDACAWFHLLLRRSPAADAARRYLGERGLGSEIAARWHLGYAPDDAAAWRRWAAETGYTEALLVEGGLFSPREEGRPERGGYPRFRHRVMFPIRNDHGDVIAFSGRVLDAAASPAKYINSPATPIFTKSQVFFGLDKSKRAIHREQAAIICEGQIDMIMCFENGIENIVAPLGTAFTPDHARLLRRHTDQVVLCFDSDNAGRKAAQSCFAELAREGIFVRVADLPAGEDPDSVLRSGGADAMRAHLSRARDFIDFLIDVKAPDGPPSDPRDRMRLLSAVTGAIARVRDRMSQEGFLQRAALRLAAPVDELRRMLTAHARQMLRHQETAAERAAPAAEPEREPLVIDVPEVRLLLQLALTDPEARNWLLDCPGTPPWQDLTGGHLLTRALVSAVDPARSESVAAWLSTLDCDEEIAVSALLVTSPPGNGCINAEIAFLKLRQRSIQRRISVLNASLSERGLSREAEISTQTQVAALHEEEVDLRNRLRDILR